MMNRRRARLLIVDDSRVIRELLGQMFGEMPGVELLGYAETADDAIAAILAQRPDCVLLDLNLKSGTGINVLQAIHPQLPKVVFIVMSNNEGEKYRQACMAAGACHFLDKTNDFNKIRFVVDCLDLSEASD
ncbi:response regulator [Chitinimonas sp.]|uniref:response regulator n=1 Tax=Chitinimonas sp. TaxID=1934313 RepID=UPI0035B2AAE8